MLIIVDNNIKSRLVAQYSDPALMKAVASKMPNTHHFLCIFHIQENLRINLASKLGQDYKSFYKNFLYIQNSLFEDDFYRHWTQLIEKYLLGQDYLNRTLNTSYQS
ncbi:8828_t:CDS:2 [Funneliformis caledonium]|uniref:8828_t:CDS:1 n=1 Tax=Funneliformis caledonium TaxID=1117310 RepID=A0A9N9H243_9GLOM|nr:8828_t:CDS:2 [Funneliformis caledonium]